MVAPRNPFFMPLLGNCIGASLTKPLCTKSAGVGSGTEIRLFSKLSSVSSACLPPVVESVTAASCLYGKVYTSTS
jgi:hypothetical protein